jgi:hypothetical protein
LRHLPVDLDDSAKLGFVRLLDGTRTRDDLARQIAVQDGATAQAAMAKVSATLTELTRLGLMLG